MVRLKQIRKEAGVTQEDLAALADISRSTIAKLEAGKMKLTAEWAARLAPHLRTSPAKLLFGKEELLDAVDLPVRIVKVRGHVQAGHWAESREWDESSFYDVAVPIDPGMENIDLYGAETRGPSMNRVYPEGSVLVFSSLAETGEAPQPGKRYIVERDRPGGELEVTVKELQLDEHGEYWLYPSSNDPRYQQRISLSGYTGETIRLVGRVLYSVNRE